MTNPTMIIVAAGQGTRLQPLTLDKPKCMVELRGKPLIQWQVEVARRAGIDKIVVVTGYLGKKIALTDVVFERNEAYATTNMVESLFCARQHFDGPFIIAYGDIIYEEKVLNALVHSEADIAIVIDTHWQSYWEARFEDPLDDAETLKLNDQGLLSEIGQKPQSLSDIEGQYIGLIKFQGQGIKALCALYDEERAAFSKGEQIICQERTLPQLYMTDILQAMIDRDVQLSPVGIEGGWLEIDDLKDLELAQECVKFGSQLHIERTALDV